MSEVQYVLDGDAGERRVEAMHILRDLRNDAQEALEEFESVSYTEHNKIIPEWKHKPTKHKHSLFLNTKCGLFT